VQVSLQVVREYQERAVDDARARADDVLELGLYSLDAGFGVGQFHIRGLAAGRK